MDGAFRDSQSSRRTTLINPATGTALCDVAAADVTEVNAAVESAQRAWESGWRDLAPGKRAAILFAVARKLRDNLEEIAQLEMLQIGKPISDARDEVGLGDDFHKAAISAHAFAAKCLAFKNARGDLEDVTQAVLSQYEEVTSNLTALAISKTQPVSISKPKQERSTKHSMT